MILGNVAFSVFALFLAISIDHTSSQCVKQSSCTCVFPNGEGYNISSLSTDTLKSIPVSNYTFAFQPCRNIVMNIVSTNSECNKSPGVSLCAYSKIQNQTYNFGTVEETTFEEVQGIETYTALVLKHESNITYIRLICCETCENPRLVMNHDPKFGQKNHLTLMSVHTCKIKMVSTGLSTGSFLVILLFIFSGIYLIGGALTMKFLRGATGLEMLPNYAFWSDFPSLVRDGIAFTFSGCKADSYDRI
ncbi:cation-dependent mannose-6-phosphate receptor [Cephus cinctus]|uniref:Cation-dependent mannose-6-phosphate receptor n=1 Tax=Cephus cinctus TaxID=211228 RepID=A0AAJ7C3S4_CEPCN|nr:cation-dependent mannose-6-phosphate receptor [Cephus cinctus]